MNQELIAWIVAIVAGSAVTKVLGLFFRGKDAGMVLGPLLGTIGAIAAWQGGVHFAGVSSVSLPLAGGLGALGGAILYTLGSVIVAQRR